MVSQGIARDMNSIRRLGIEALTEKLGPIGMIEFIRQFDSGYGVKGGYLSFNSNKIML
jgi:hypothetical protein